MGMFLLADGTHIGFDKHRNRFFWEGQGDKRKYHLVNWKNICRPKSQGGLGVLNTKPMNISLMEKMDLVNSFRSELGPFVVETVEG
jgi:hypothetical protein